RGARRGRRRRDRARGARRSPGATRRRGSSRAIRAGHQPGRGGCRSRGRDHLRSAQRRPRGPAAAGATAPRRTSPHRHRSARSRRVRRWWRRARCLRSRLRARPAPGRRRRGRHRLRSGGRARCLSHPWPPWSTCAAPRSTVCHVRSAPDAPSPISTGHLRPGTMAAMTSVGLVLGAGGVVGGAYHAGALAEVAGWDARNADVIVGTSAGSIAGAALRAGLSGPDQLARATNAPLSPEGERLVGHLSPVVELPMRPPFPRGLPLPASPQLAATALLPPWSARPLAALAGLLPAGSVPTAPIGDRIRALFDGTWPEQALWICA